MIIIPGLTRMNRFEAARVQKMWREKDVQAIRDHTVREIDRAERNNERGAASNVIELFKGKE